MSQSALLGMTSPDEHQLSFRGAMLMATIRQAGCAVFVSEDLQHGRRLGGVEIVNPFAPPTAAAMATALDS